MNITLDDVLKNVKTSAGKKGVSRSMVRDEHDLSRKLCRYITGAIQVENKVRQGIPDLCIPNHTRDGWRWIELKMLKGKHIEFRKDQWAYLNKCHRELPLKLCPCVLVATYEGVCYIYYTDTILGLRNRATKAGVSVWPSTPIESQFTIKEIGEILNTA